MSFFQSLLAFLDTSMTKPTMYGWFHILWLGITVACCLWFCLAGKKWQPRRVVLVVALLSIVLEIYKQINYSFSYDDGITFRYQWYAFPFQFCSTPMYVGLLAGLTRKGKIHQAACSYLATYAVFAGVCVMAYPATVFISTIGINIQTMICHGSMIVVGVYLLASGYVPVSVKTLLRALPVFLVCVALAAGMNELAHCTGLLQEHTFDMFFISPYGTPSLPVYSMVQGVVPFPWCLGLYVLGFTAAAGLCLAAAAAVKAVCTHRRHKESSPAIGV